MLVITGCAAESDDAQTEPEVLAAVVTAERTPTGPDGRTPQVCEPGRVWTSTSRRIEVSSYSFWQGSSGYRAERGSLTTAQLNALRGLCVRPPPSGPILADLIAYRIVVTDNSGAVKSYRSVIDNQLDGDEADHSLPTIDYSTLKPFLSTFRCLAAAESRAVAPRRGAVEEDLGPAWQYAPTLTTDPSCLHGVFAGYGCQDTWMKVSVNARKRYTFVTEGCLGVVQLKLFDQTATTEIATSSASSKPNCPSLSYMFAPGNYLLNLRKTNANGSCATNGSGGDYRLRVTSP